MCRFNLETVKMHGHRLVKLKYVLTVYRVWAANKKVKKKPNRLIFNNAQATHYKFSGDILGFCTQNVLGKRKELASVCENSIKFLLKRIRVIGKPSTCALIDSIAYVSRQIRFVYRVISTDCGRKTRVRKNNTNASPANQHGVSFSYLTAGVWPESR